MHDKTAKRVVRSKRTSKRQSTGKGGDLTSDELTQGKENGTCNLLILATRQYHQNLCFQQKRNVKRTYSWQLANELGRSADILLLFHQSKVENGQSQMKPSHASQKLFQAWKQQPVRCKLHQQAEIRRGATNLTARELQKTKKKPQVGNSQVVEAAELELAK